jgi:hypothetical protein
MLSSSEKNARWLAEAHAKYPDAVISGEGQWATLVVDQTGRVVKVLLAAHQSGKSYRDENGVSELDRRPAGGLVRGDNRAAHNKLQREK